MDDKREERRKESIDEILSDLNGLLNKMPAILEGIKLSDVKPVDFLSPQMPEPAADLDIRPEILSEPAPGSACESDSGKLQEPSTAAGIEERPLTEGDIIYNSGTSEERRTPGIVIEEEKNKLVPQSLGEYMFSRNDQPEPEITECRATPPEPIIYPEPLGLNSSPVFPEIEPEVSCFNLETLKDDEAVVESSFKPGPEKAEDEKTTAVFERTRDFGVPDIDTLIGLLQKEVLPVEQPGADEEFKNDGNVNLDGVGSAGGSEKQAEPVSAAAPADDVLIQPEPVLERIESALAVPEAETQPAPGPDLGNIVIAPRVVSADEKGETMNIKMENLGNDEPSKPADAEEIILPVQTEPVKQEPAVPEAGAAGAEPRLERSSPNQFTLKANAPAPTEPGLVIERNPVFNSPTPAAAPGDNDKTMVFPPAAAMPEEAKTVIYKAAADSGVTSGGDVDLGPLAERPVPDGIPAERVRTIAFIYAQEDAGFCAEMLKELDSICLKSTSKPMFIKRGFVMVCAPGVSGNVYMQKVADAGAAGLICMGNIPQENIYEMENVFTAGGVFFKHFPRAAFTHSAALDLVTEFILR
ncbi:MAG: hypothetical protein WCK75_03810 [Elusimicrobiota bacterium]